MQKDALDIRLVEHVVARIFPRSSRLSIEQVDEGVSTYVYRIYYAAEKFYLRVLPEINASFAPEVHVHQLLRDKQVNVPEFAFFEHFIEHPQRSTPLTSDT